MSLQELPRTVATGAVKLVRLPLEFANGARERIADRIGGDDEQATASMPTAEPTKPKPAKAAPKPRKPAAARTKPKAAAKSEPKPRKSAATKPESAKPHRTPVSKSPTAEQPEVVAEQTEGLEDATDRAIAERRSLR